MSTVKPIIIGLTYTYLELHKVQGLNFPLE